MRTAFIQTLLKHAKRDPHIMLLTGDLGFSVFETYQKELPRQYINMGVAEQNMTGVAAGMATEGLRPIIYSIVPFVTMRNFEQIRNDICYQNLNVKIVGVGAGYSYGTYGHSHYGLEDIGILRTIPNLVILAPGDPLETTRATTLMLRHKGPVYLRLGKAGEPIIHKRAPNFKIGKGIVLEEGRDVTIIATSTMLEQAVLVAQSLSTCSVRLVSMPSIKPLDRALIRESARKTRAIVTIEEHSIIGGLGSTVAEVLAEERLSVAFARIGTHDQFVKTGGLREYMRSLHGLTVKQITGAIRKLLKQKK
jgi:transketolase